MQTIEKLISILSGWVWGPPMLILLVGTGLYLTILLKGLQFRALPLAFRMIWEKDHGHAGDISHFQALMTALAATVGIGNIVGVATAITLGGPGAVFWMWMTGLVGMVTKYSEAVLAVTVNQPGSVAALTAAEIRVLQFLPSHLTFPQIGEHLFLSANTVKTHALSIYRKLGATSRNEAVTRAQSLGLVEAPMRT